MDSLAGFVAQYLYLIILAVGFIYLLFYYRLRLVDLGIAFIVIGGLAYLFSKVGTNLVLDPRPFIQTGKPPLIPSATDNGFPSDHTLLLSTLAAVMTLFNWKSGLLFWLAALLVGLARVYAGVHHLLDIAGSVVIVLVATGLYLAGKKLWLKFSPLKRGLPEPELDTTRSER